MLKGWACSSVLGMLYLYVACKVAEYWPNFEKARKGARVVHPNAITNHSKSLMATAVGGFIFMKSNLSFKIVRFMTHLVLLSFLCTRT